PAAGSSAMDRGRAKAASVPLRARKLTPHTGRLFPGQHRSTVNTRLPTVTDDQSAAEARAKGPTQAQNPAQLQAQPAPRPRPRSLDPRELGFTPQPPVPWLAPLLLLSTGLRTLLAMLFGAYLDKRELQNSLPREVPRHDAINGELWLDYVADLGDGFDATYSVAYLLAQRELTIDGKRLPRGHILV